MPDRSSSLFQPWLRLVLGTLGAVSIGAGATAVFVTVNGTGTAVLLAFGGILLALAVLGDRIESVKLGGTKVKLRAAAEAKFALAEDYQHQGKYATADRLRAEGNALLDAAGPIASEYRKLRGSMPVGKERTAALEGLVERARKLADKGRYEPAEVSSWLRGSSEGNRIIALVMMEAKPELRDVDAVFAAVKDPSSAFEHYHAMRVAECMIADLDADQQRRLAELIKEARSHVFGPEASRWRLSDRMLDSLNGHAAGV
jgi:hypothetical protein